MSEENDSFDLLDVFELYHILQEETHPTSQGGPVLPALGHAIAGAIASASAKLVVYPIETVVTRLQVQKQLHSKDDDDAASPQPGTQYTSFADAAVKIFRREGGLRPFYTGVSSDVFKGVADSFLFFLAYQVLRSVFQARHQAAAGGGASKGLPVVQELGVGVLAGCFSKAVTTPIQNIVTRQQTAALLAAQRPNSAQARHPLTIREIAHSIHADRGLAGFWSGYSAAIILTLNPAMTFAAENFLKRLLIPPAQRKNPPAVRTFLAAALSKVIATSVTYPVQLAKAQAQAGGGKRKGQGKAQAGGARPKLSLRSILSLFEGQAKIVSSLAQIHRSEGLHGLYSGLEGEVLKGFIQHGLTMLLKDRVHGGVVGTYYALLKATQTWPEEIEAAVKG